MKFISILFCFFFFFNDTATTEIYTLSLHDALPISLAPTLVEEISGGWAHCPVQRTASVRLHYAASGEPVQAETFRPSGETKPGPTPELDVRLALHPVGDGDRRKYFSAGFDASGPTSTYPSLRVIPSRRRFLAASMASCVPARARTSPLPSSSSALGMIDRKSVV